MHIGGLENQLMHLIRNADKTKYLIDYTTTMKNPYYKKEIEELGGKCIYIENTENGRNIIQYCRELYSIIKSGKYDVVHSHELFHSGIVLAIAKYAGVKVRFSHAHSCNQEYGFNVVRHIYNSCMRALILRNANGLLACSSIAAEFLYGKSVFSDERYHLMVNSVDTSKYLLESMDYKNSGSLRKTGWKNVIQIGRFSEEKNYFLTCKIACFFKENGIKIRFICVGNDGNEYEKKIRKEISDLKIEEYMLLLGIRNDVDFLLKESDAFILPSMYEGMPLTLIEAQTSGLHCVVADTFSHEVDFNIGSITWLSLNDSIVKWAGAVADAVKVGKSDQKAIVEAIQKYGFDSIIFSNRVCDLYDRELKKN